jgi:protein-S-isoprenylcysteine O-methyltransferase Ste14
VPAVVQSTLPLTGHGARLLLQATVVAFMLSEIGNRVRSARHSGGTRADRGSIVLVVACIAVGLLAAGWAVASSSGVALPGGWWSFCVGIALMWFGIALRQWSVLALGRYFTVAVRVVEDQRVVDSGPYRWVRHPSYTGLLLSLVGLGAALGSWLSLVSLAVLPTVGLVVRIRVEESALLAAIGEPYRRYAERRRRLVPGIW